VATGSSTPTYLWSQSTGKKKTKRGNKKNQPAPCKLGNIAVTARRNAAGIFAISAAGHSGYADLGSDIVCAAVSTLVQALRTGLVDVLELEGVKFSSDPNVPVMTLEWDGANIPAQQFASTILLSLKGVAASYPDFVNITEVFEEETDDEERDEHQKI
jgi:uncharacterized protein YsxB (DUF464 family)